MTQILIRIKIKWILNTEKKYFWSVATLNWTEGWEKGFLLEGLLFLTARERINGSG